MRELRRPDFEGASLGHGQSLGGGQLSLIAIQRVKGIRLQQESRSDMQDVECTSAESRGPFASDLFRSLKDGAG